MTIGQLAWKYGIGLMLFAQIVQILRVLCKSSVFKLTSFVCLCFHLKYTKNEILSKTNKLTDASELAKADQNLL